jgi:HEAT repeat protein
MPDLERLRESPEVYYERHRQAIADGDFQARVMANWGMIARGSASLPYLATMLKSSSPDAREDAAGAYGWLAQHEPAVVNDLIDAVRSEDDVVARDSIAMALGVLKDNRALPVLAELLRDPLTDSDSRSLVIEAIGRIARRRFDKKPDPERAVLEYLASKGY